MESAPITSVVNALMTRRSVPRFRSDPVPRELIERALEAAVWSPNHRMTEPWQFFVLQGEGKQRFAERRREFTRSTIADPDAPEKQKVLENVYQMAVAAPAIVVVTAAIHENLEQREEDYWATYGAAYAFMLALWSEGVGSYFRTGGLRDYPPLREFLHLGDERRIIGFVYVGFAETVPQKRRTPAAEKTVWLD
ncbi:MAG TPA: nitroreductase [bacterium]|jgi:nitroreductase